MPSRDGIDAALAPFGTSAAGLAASIGVRDGEAGALLTGSIAEGFSTPTSDIDIIVIYPAGRTLPGLPDDGAGQGEPVALLPGDASFPLTNSLIVNRPTAGGFKLQLELTTVDRVARLQARVTARMDNVRARLAGIEGSRHRKGVMLTVPEQKFMDRIYRGIPLNGGTIVERVRGAMPFSELTSHVAIIRSTTIYHLSSDLRGLCALHPSGEVDTKAYLVQSLVIGAAGLLLASIGEINSSEKFYFRLLRRHDADIGGGLAATLGAAFLDAAALARTAPRQVEGLVASAFARAVTFCPLLEQEYAAWKAENDFRDAGAPP